MTIVQSELRAERHAIMSVEGATESEIMAVIANYPEYYGIMKSDEIEGELF